MVGTGSVSARRAPLAFDRRVVAPHARQAGRAIDPAHRAQAPLDARPGCLRGAGLLGLAAPAAMCHKVKPRLGGSGRFGSGSTSGVVRTMEAPRLI